ncbi:MAG: MerR family transcriptional regulator [Actinobacteria bacterium]|uniref:Unannotated protein n=1 Tax=freshwater metagenome TaxID=449393 RepID=A0A6J5YL24_9ZZZZ|nr:MerR family transcriptional regulator [Actinomycetota bacterium]
MPHKYHFDDETPLYVISIAAQLSGLHPQTLRQYDRLGLVSPGRTLGHNRLYSQRDINRLRTVASLSADGISLVGIERILELQEQLERALLQLEILQEQVQSNAIVVWRPRRD